MDLEGTVFAKNATRDEARQRKQKLIKQLNQLLKDATIGFGDITKEVEEEGKDNLDKTIEIQGLVENLSEDIETTNVEDTGLLVTRVESIMELFKQLDRDVGYISSLIKVETDIVLAQLAIMGIKDADEIIIAPRTLKKKGWTFFKEYRRIAEAIQGNIPTFQGYTVLTRGDPHAINIFLVSDVPIPVPPLTALDNLALIVEIIIMS